MEQKLSDTLVKAIDRSNPMMQNLQLASRFNALVESGGGDVVLEDNKAVTIDVSTYTGAVEVTPTSGKDAMKKTTVSLSNIPAGGGYNFKDAHSFKLFGFAQDEQGSGYQFLLIDANGLAIDDIANIANATTALLLVSGYQAEAFTVTAGVIEGYPIRCEDYDDTVANLIELVGYGRYY